MKIIKLSKEEYLHYCNKEEDHFFDKKAVKLKGEKVQKIAVAFANADGGEILIGIADDKDEPEPAKRWQGYESTESFNSIIQALSEPNPSIDFRFDFLRKDSEARNYVLRVRINKGLEVHETTAGRVFLRKGAQSLPITGPIKLMELAHAKGIRSAEDSLVETASPDEIENSEALKQYLAALPISPPEALDFLLKQELLDRESWIPKVAGILLFNDNPSNVIPKQCAIKIVRYDTKDDDIDRDALTSDIITVEGCLHKQIIDAYECIEKLLKKNTVWTMDGKQSISYPAEAIWEILVNTVIHRDYSISDNIQINIFNNRIVFRSPGRLPGFVTVDNILDNRFSRNSKIVRLLSKYSDSPNKDLGEGINTAFQRMNESGLMSPAITEDGNYVIVTIHHVSNKESGDVILEFLEKFGEINNFQARDLTGITFSEKITDIFGKLKAQGKIKRKDGSTGIKSTWILAEEGAISPA